MSNGPSVDTITMSGNRSESIGLLAQATSSSATHSAESSSLVDGGFIGSSENSHSRSNSMTTTLQSETPLSTSVISNNMFSDSIVSTTSQSSATSSFFTQSSVSSTILTTSSSSQSSNTSLITSSSGTSSSASRSTLTSIKSIRSSSHYTSKTISSTLTYTAENSTTTKIIVPSTHYVTTHPYQSSSITSSVITNLASPSGITNSKSSGSSVNVGAIVGGVIGGIVGLILLILLVAWFIIRAKRRNNKKRELESDWLDSNAVTDNSFEKDLIPDPLHNDDTTVANTEAENVQPANSPSRSQLASAPGSPSNPGSPNSLTRSPTSPLMSYRGQMTERSTVMRQSMIMHTNNGTNF